jgi:CDP-diacylglycerol--serine O-phosphatidyltransferase
MKKHIPNAFTMMNLFSGCIALAMAFSENFLGVVIWVLIAAAFDFFDGFAARLLGVTSPLGKELDSLADVVSFGVAPGSAVFILLRNFSVFPLCLTAISPYIPFMAYLIPVFSALRLGKFNLDEKQTSSFLGLPTPANALFWISYCYGVQHIAPVNGALLYLTLGFILVLSLLMVSNIPMFSFKITAFKFKGNEKQILLVFFMIAFIALWGILGIAVGILAYIIISLIANMW